MDCDVLFCSSCYELHKAARLKNHRKEPSLSVTASTSPKSPGGLIAKEKPSNVKLKGLGKD